MCRFEKGCLQKKKITKLLVKLCQTDPKTTSRAAFAVAIFEKRFGKIVSLIASCMAERGK